jgi:hypothetical protein
MLHSEPNPMSKKGWFKFPAISRARIINFIKDVYQLHDHHPNEGLKHENKGFPSIERKP